MGDRLINNSRSQSCSRLRLKQLLRIFRALQTSRVLRISMNARWRVNQLFYYIFNPVENLFLEGFVCWRHERAQ